MSSPQQCHFPCLHSTLPSKAWPFLLKQNQKNERTKRKRLFHLTIAMTVDFKLYATLMSWNLVGRVSFQHGASVHLSVKPHLSLMQIVILLRFLFWWQNDFRHLTQTSDRLHQGLTIIITIWSKPHSVAVPKSVTGQVAWYCQFSCPSDLWKW